MAYLVLARKWRPLTFADLVGQGHIAQTLTRAIETGRIGHAYLFTGTRGVGKTTSARILAMALNCEKGPTPTPCGKCSACREIQSGTGLDVLEIDGASNRGVDDVRELREKVGYVPAGGKYRIVIIDEVHMLTKEAFNALLKTLEEPPPNFVFIFATTEPQKVPETILSRVQRHDFRRVGLAETVERLKTICKAETIDFEEGALAVIARKAAGSMRDALTLLDQVLPACEGKLAAGAARSVLGLVDEEVYLSIFDQILEKNEPALMAGVADVFGRGYDLSEFSLGLEEHARNLLVAGMMGITAETLNLTPEIFEKLKNQAGKFKKLDLLRGLELLSNLSYRVSRSSLPRFEVEAALLKLANMASAVDIGRLLQSLEGSGPVAASPASFVAAPGASAAHGRAASTSPVLRPASAAAASGANPAPGRTAPPPEASSAPSAPEASGGGDIQSLPAQWAAIMENISSEHMQLATYLAQSEIRSASAARVVIGVPAGHKFHQTQLTRPENMGPLKSFLSKRFGFKGEVAVEIIAQKAAPVQKPVSAVPAPPLQAPAKGPSVPSPVPAGSKPVQTTAKPPEPVRIDDAIEKEPILGSVLDIFNGEVQ